MFQSFLSDVQKTTIGASKDLGSLHLRLFIEL